MKKMVLGLMVVAGLLGTSTVVANAADTDLTGKSTADVSFSSGQLSMSVDGTPLSFGTTVISGDTTPLKASNSSPTVTVNDFRGNNAGWSLTVTQDKQFSTESGDSVLNNAQLTVVSTKILGDSGITTKTAPLVPGTTTSGTTTNGSAVMVASASAGVGNGRSQFQFGGSTLSKLSETTRLVQKYTTTLIWNLSDTPSN